MRRLPPYAKDGLGILGYLLLLGSLYRFDWMTMFQPLPLGSVFGGAVILTLSRWKKGTSLYVLWEDARRNAFLAGLMTGLLQLLSLMSATGDDPITTHSLAHQLIPVLYGSFFVLPWGTQRHLSDSDDEDDLMPQTDSRGKSKQNTQERTTILQMTPQHPFFKEHGFTPRECHVAMKILGDTSNREIAESLYISETTVKKHIQNMFRKCGAIDRRSFRKLFME